MKKGNRIIIVATLPDYEDDAGDHTLEDVATYLTSSGVTLKDATIYGDAEDLVKDLSEGNESVSCAFQKTCEACGGRRWLHSKSGHTGIAAIERCDQCSEKTLNDAQAHVLWFNDFLQGLRAALDEHESGLPAVSMHRKTLRKVHEVVAGAVR